MRPSKYELKLINSQSKVRLKPEDVYVFTINLCNNDIDRDGERFTSDSLYQMEKLFSGASGIIDTRLNDDDSNARILCCSVTRTNKLTQIGLPLLELKARVWMRRKGNEALIYGIEQGLVRHASVGVAVEHSDCSICHTNACAHFPGKWYNGELCYKNLEDISTVYSFAAILDEPTNDTWTYKDYDRVGYTERMYLHSRCPVNSARLHSSPAASCSECGAKMQKPQVRVKSKVRKLPTR